MANEFEISDLKDWGFKDFELMGIDKIGEINSSDENSEWVGMPEFGDGPEYHKIIITFDNLEDMEKFSIDHPHVIFTKKLGKVWASRYPFEKRADLSAIKYE